MIPFYSVFNTEIYLLDADSTEILTVGTIERTMHLELNSHHAFVLL